MPSRAAVGARGKRKAGESALDASFAGAMARLGPFEPQVELAVAISGGADSLTLALLADRWARARGGRITALTVDHGLRAESAGEARRVGRWLKAAGIRHRVLRWSPSTRRGEKRLPNLQAAARDARYDLLCGWCRDHRILHLLLAHHRDDQAETLLLRLARGSGLDGLAAMAPLAERASVRLLRPLLDLSKAQCVEFLTARGQAWIEDPSNRDTANARVRMRRLMPQLAAEGLTSARLADTAQRLAQARVVLEDAVTRLLGEAVALYPEGYLRLSTARLRAAEREVGLRALARIIACIGGAAYGPRLERITRLYESLAKLGAGVGRGVTLGGCRILPADRQAKIAASSDLLILREAAAIAQPVSLADLGRATRAGAACREIMWDGRFRITLSRPVSSGKGNSVAPRRTAYSIGALGEDGLRRVKQATSGRGAGEEGRSAGLGVTRGLPRDVIIALPALRRGAVLVAVPHLGYRRETPHVTDMTAMAGCQVDFVPLSPLTRPGFTLV